MKTKTAFILLPWGFVFTVLDLAVGGFDILPDFVGYSLIALGARRLASLHSNFRKVSVYALGLLIASLGLISPIPFVQLSPRVALAAYIVFWLGLAIADVMMVWLVCGAIRDLAQAAKNGELARAAITRWKMYIATPVIGLFVIVLSPMLPPLGMLFAVIVLLGYSLLVMVLMFHLLRTSYDKLSGLGPMRTDLGRTPRAETGPAAAAPAAGEKGIRTREMAKVAIIEMFGRVTDQDLNRFRAMLEERLESGQRDFILNIAAVPDLDSGGVAQIVDFVELARRHDARLKLVTRRKSKIYEALKSTTLDDGVDIYGDEQDALASLVL